MNQPAKSLTRRLAQYVLSGKLSDMEQPVVDRAMDSLRDSVGCMFASAQNPSVVLARQFAQSKGVRSQANALGMERGIDAPLAALINATAINALDYDDVTVIMNGHPSAIVLASAMAAAEKYGSSGTAFLEAYILGVEVASLLGRGCCPASFAKGWHCTSVLSVFGAVAAVGKLAGATEDQLTNALGIAASEASGVKANLGSAVKPLHCGRSAQKAFDAVEFAMLGCTANPEAIEGPHGLGTLIAGHMDVDKVYAAMDQGISVFQDPGMQLKPYACCKNTQTGICGLLSLMQEYNILPSQIRSITCSVQEMIFPGFTTQKETAEQRKLNMHFCLAAAAIHGTLRLDTFEGETIAPEILNMMECICVHPDPALAAYRQDTVQVVLEDIHGFRWTKTVEYAKGELQVPMTQDEIKAKFMDCCCKSISRERAEAVWEKLTEICSVEDCAGFFAEVIGCQVV